MKVGVTHHDANILGIDKQQLLDHGCERLAGLTGGIEKLDNGDRRLRAPRTGECGRISRAICSGVRAADSTGTAGGLPRHGRGWRCGRGRRGVLLEELSTPSGATANRESEFHGSPACQARRFRNSRRVRGPWVGERGIRRRNIPLATARPCRARVNFRSSSAASRYGFVAFSPKTLARSCGVISGSRACRAAPPRSETCETPGSDPAAIRTRSNPCPRARCLRRRT